MLGVHGEDFRVYPVVGETAVGLVCDHCGAQLGVARSYTLAQLVAGAVGHDCPRRRT